MTPGLLARETHAISMTRGPQISVDACVLVACVFFTVVGNRPFWNALLVGRAWTDAATWLLAGAVFTAITLLHFAVLAAVCNRWTVKPILAVLLIINPLALSAGVPTLHADLRHGRTAHVHAGAARQYV